MWSFTIKLNDKIFCRNAQSRLRIIIKEIKEENDFGETQKETMEPLTCCKLTTLLLTLLTFLTVDSTYVSPAKLESSGNE